MKPHKHAELIKAWADGAEIEIKDRATGWWGAISVGGAWYEEDEYRIKPKPKPDVFTYTSLEKWRPQLCLTSRSVWLTFDTEKKSSQNNLKLIWDGETGELKSAEVLK